MSEPLFKNDDSSHENDDEPTKHDGFDIFGSVLNEILKKINSDFVMADGNLTSSGIIAQGIFLSLAYIVIDLLVSGGIL